MTNSVNAIQLLKKEQTTLNAITLFNYGTDKDVSSIVLNEISVLESMSLAKPEILQCESSSVVQATKYILKNNLSFDPLAGLVYVKTRNVAVEKDQAGKATKWAKVLEVQPTCEGKLSIAYQCGKILDHERPVVKKDEKGRVIEVTFKYLKPSITGHRWVETTFDESDFKRRQTASHKENSRGKNDAAQRSYANPNYTSFNGGIDPEFARAKSIIHGLKKMGTNANERLNVNVKPAISHTINQEVDMSATGEVFTDDAANEYYAFEELPPTNTVHVEMHKEIEIPSL